jgi:hypothetical protein
MNKSKLTSKNLFKASKAMGIMVFIALSSIKVLAEQSYYYSEEDSLESAVEQDQQDIDKSKKAVLEAEHKLKLAKQNVNINEREMAKSKQKLSQVTKGKKFFKVNFSAYAEPTTSLARSEWVSSVCNIKPQVPYKQIDTYYNSLNLSYGDNRKDVERRMVKQELELLQSEVLAKIAEVKEHHMTKYSDVIEKDINITVDMDGLRGEGPFYCEIEANVLLSHKP